MPKKRLVLCMGPHCNADDRSAPLYARLHAKLGDPMPGFMARGPVHWEIANCLDMCELGPNLIVYPDETAYHGVDLDALDAIMSEHLSSIDND